MATFYDTHAHLYSPDFQQDLLEIIERASGAGITRIITIGTDLQSSRACVLLSQKFPSVYAAVGWHPSDVMEAPKDIRQELLDLAKDPKVVALGETGLDYYRLPSRSGASAAEDALYKERQAELFRQHLEVAAETGLGCVVHQRESFADCVRQLAPFSSRVKTVFHCFAGTVAEMGQVFELGSIVSFTGILTFKNGENIRHALAAAPDGKFMLETDCPYLAPVPYRGKRCEPAYVKETAAVAAQVRNCTLEHLGRVTCDTAHKFFPKIG